jgi:hypothetical protein
MLTLSDALGRNRILAGLPVKERQCVEPYVDVTTVHLGDVIDRPGEAIRYLHFPVDAAVSMMDLKDRTHTLDVALIGPEGCSGASVAQGSDVSPSLNLVEIGGSTVRLPAQALAEHLGALPYLSSVLSRYNLLLMRHVVISVGCSQFHSHDQRVARWLLAHSHRTGLTVFPFTTEFLSAQVGMDRDTIRSILEDMQKHGILSKTANSVSISDRHALARQSCGCFALTTEATDGYLDAVSRLSRAHAHSHPD